MITRTVDKEAIQEALSSYQDEYVGLDLDEWIASPFNIALTNEDGDISMFERQHLSPDMVYGHYFFRSRGRKAINAGKDMIREIFTGPYEVGAIAGLTPVEHKAALWMNKQLGFSHLDTIETMAGDHRLVYLSKNTWENMENE